MKAFNVISNTYIDSSKKINDKDPKLKISDNVRISEYQNMLVYTPNWSEDNFVIKNVKNAVPWTYVINDIDGE